MAQVESNLSRVSQQTVRSLICAKFKFEFSTNLAGGKTSLTKRRKKEKKRRKTKRTKKNEKNETCFQRTFFEKTEQKASFRPKNGQFEKRKNEKRKKNERNERFWFLSSEMFSSWEKLSIFVVVFVWIWFFQRTFNGNLGTRIAKIFKLGTVTVCCTPLGSDIVANIGNFPANSQVKFPEKFNCFTIWST
jgi:hypothetical protein